MGSALLSVLLLLLTKLLSNAKYGWESDFDMNASIFLWVNMRELIGLFNENKQKTKRKQPLMLDERNDVDE